MSDSYLYALPASCYPRYKYFREHLQRVLPNIQNIYVTFRHFSKHFDDQFIDYERICHKFGNIVNVEILHEKENLPILERRLMKSKPVKKEMPLVKRSKNVEYVTETRQRSKDRENQILTVKVCPKEVQTVETREAKRTKLDDDPINSLYNRNIIVRYSVRRPNHVQLYTDDGKKQEKNLGEVIQYLLEKNVVEVFKEIIRYNKFIMENIESGYISKGLGDDHKSKMRMIQTVERLQFQVYGILRQSEVNCTEIIPSIPDIKPEMKNEILKLSGVKGCGTVLGVLTVYFVGKCEKKKAVEDILQKYEYKLSCRIETNTRFSHHTNPAYASGSAIQARGNPPRQEEEKLGTLGCYVKLMPQGETEQALEERSKHFITCGHCVNAIDELIDIKTPLGIFLSFGKTKYILNENMADLAIVKVEENRVRRCDSSIFRSCGSLSTKVWSFFDGNVPCGLPVYKVGPKSDITHGMVASGSDLSIVMQEQQPVTNENVLIVVPEETPNQDIFFSFKGESGSVICTDDVNNAERVKVVALLVGPVQTRLDSDQENQFGNFKASYSYHMQRSLTYLEIDHHLNCQPDCEDEEEVQGVYEHVFE